MNREKIESLEEELLGHCPDAEGAMNPFVYADIDDVETDEGPFPFPIMTDMLLSADWEATDQIWFVDASGVGSSGESALTADAFRRQLIEYVRENPDHGFGLTGVGQFQVYVTAYRPVE